MEEDLQLISNVKNTNDGESLKELIDRHSGIYVDMVNKYIPKSIEGICKEDILDDNGWVNDSHTHAEYKGMKAGLTMLINHLEETQDE